MNTEITNNREELDREESERFAEKVCGLRNIYQKEVEA